MMRFQFTRRVWLLLGVFAGLVGVRLAVGFDSSKPSQNLPPRRPVESGDEFGWLSDYQEARHLAKKTGMPIMVVFRCFP